MDHDATQAHTLPAMEQPEKDPLIGRILDQRYRVTGQLGAGGMGIVYHARHEVLGSRLAIKVLRPEAAGKNEAIARLRREAQAASAIGNEHIVDVRDFGELEDGSTYVVMELIDGCDLYSLVRSSPFPWRRARSIALQVCDALGAAHAQGVVHRDLKLENVLLTTRVGQPDFVKVVDFGIAMVQGSAKLTAAGRVIGTPEYMSPEQCAGGAVDHRTDVYSLGVMLYEMVTGQLPFYDEDLTKLVYMQMHDAPVAPSAAAPEIEIPLLLDAVILRCLAKDPAARHASMSEVAEDLEAIELEEPPARARYVDAVPTASIARPEPSVGSPRTTTRVRASGARRAWIGLSAVIVLGVGIALGAAHEAAPVEHAPRPMPPRASSPPDEPLRAPDEPPANSRAAPSEPAIARHAPPASASLEITIESTPRARVLGANGALLGETPIDIPRPAAGERVALELRAAGFAPHTLTLSDETASQLRLVLARRAAPRRGPDPVASSTPPVAPEERPAQAPPMHREFLDPWGSER